MGTCVSSHRNRKSDSEEDMKWFNNDQVIPPSPTKQKQNQIQIVNENGNVDVKPHMMILPHFGSKEETFFDSQAWLESDCESDFMSVNGEFTPSRGNTPMHHDFTTDEEKPCMTPSASPVKKKKRLSELFSESLRENHSHDEENAEPVSANGVAESLKVAAVCRGDSKSGSKREIVHVHSCLPRVLSSCRPPVTSHQTQVRRK